MAPHSSALAWKIPRTEGPDRLQSMESLRVSNYKELYNDNKPNNDGRTNNGLAGEAPQTNAERAGEWATNRIKEIVEKSKRKNQGGVHGELPDGGSNDRFLLPF